MLIASRLGQTMSEEFFPWHKKMLDILPKLKTLRTFAIACSLDIVLESWKVVLSLLKSGLLEFPSLKSGLLDSNQRPHAPQTRALPTAPNPVFFLKADAKVILSFENKVNLDSNFRNFANFYKKLVN